MHALAVSNLTVAAKRQGRVLLTVDQLDVDAGALIGIQGPSGAGKSTLLFALAGLWARTSGRVVWGDTDIVPLKQQARTAFRRNVIGMIFQDFLLFEELGAKDNAALAAMFGPAADRSAIQANATTQLSTLGIPETTRGVDSFSGGERQRIAVARALAADPPVILADEPTASLHRDAADALADDLCTLARAGGKTMIAVSHDPHLLDRMDRVITMRDGALVGG